MNVPGCYNLDQIKSLTLCAWSKANTTTKTCNNEVCCSMLQLNNKFHKIRATRRNLGVGGRN